jgi:hypothetical protein
MKKLLYGYVLLLAAVSGLGASYTFRVCYNGSDDPEVAAPDSVTVKSVIHGGSACWAPMFSATVNKGQYKDIVFDVPTSNQPMNCHLVPETANGSTIRPISGSWPVFSLGGPSNPDGETWQIKKTKPVVETRPTLNLPGMESTPISFSIEWFGEKQEGLHECQVFEAAPVKMMLARPAQTSQQTVERVALSAPAIALPEAVAETETAVLVQPELVQPESWIDWSKRWGSRIGVMAVLYALARQMPGSTIRSFEGAVGNLGRMASNYISGYVTPAYQDMELGLTEHDIMGGQGMIGPESEMRAQPVPVSLAEIFPESVKPAGAYTFQLQEPRRRVQLSETPVVSVSQALASFPILSTIAEEQPSVSSTSTLSSLSVPSAATSSSSISFSVPPSPVSSRSATPEISTRSVPPTPTHAARRAVHAARGGAPILSPREQRAILAHLTRTTGTSQSPETQPWVSKIRH